MLPDEKTSPEQIAIFRAMSGVEKWKLAEQMFWTARKLKAAGLRVQHPDWTEVQIDEAVREIFINGHT